MQGGFSTFRKVIKSRRAETLAKFSIHDQCRNCYLLKGVVFIHGSDNKRGIGLLFSGFVRV